MSALRIKCRTMFPVGKAFVAISPKGQIVNAISVVATKEADFQDFCAKARTALSTLGRVVYGEIVHEDGACFFVRKDSVVEAQKKRNVKVDLNADWRQYQPQPLAGWTMKGVVSQGESAGALAENTESGEYALIVQNEIIALDPQRIRAALYKLTGIKTPKPKSSVR